MLETIEIKSNLNKKPIKKIYLMNYSNRHIEPKEVFKLNREFYDEKFKNRIVTCMDWSPHVIKKQLLL
jgi:hypothetical protein